MVPDQPILETTPVTTPFTKPVRVYRPTRTAMQQGKALVRAGLETHQTAHLAMQRQAFAGLFGTADKVEGVTAFLEKRPAVWQGR